MPEKSDISNFDSSSNPSLSAQESLKIFKSGRFLQPVFKLCQMTVPKYPFKPAKLIHYNYNLKKRWYVDYCAWDISKEKLVRVRQFEPLNREKNLHKRIELGTELVRVINGQLRSGMCLGKETKVVSPVNSVDLRKLSVGQAIDAFVAHKELAKAKHNYRKRYKFLKAHWINYLATRGHRDFVVTSVDQTDLAGMLEWLQTEKQIGNKTYNNYLSDFSIFFNWLVGKKAIKQNPATGIAKLKTVAHKHTAFTDDQIQSIHARCRAMGEDDLLLFIQFIYYTLARPGNELRLMKVKDIDLAANRIFIPGEVSKNGRDEFVPIAPPLRKAILQSNRTGADPEFYFFGSAGVPGPKPTNKLYFYRRNRKVLQALKMDGSHYSVYSYKHSGAINLYRATKDIKLLQALCRHRSLEMTNIYLRDLGLDNDYQALEGWTGPMAR